MADAGLLSRRRWTFYRAASARMGIVAATLSSGAWRRFKALALWLGLSALMVHGLAPYCLAGALVSASGDTIVICTVHGQKTIRIGADGAALPDAPPSNDSGSACLACVMCSDGPALKVSALVAAPRPPAQAKSDVATKFLPSARGQFSYSTRAPPLFA